MITYTKQIKWLRVATISAALVALSTHALAESDVGANHGRILIRHLLPVFFIILTVMCFNFWGWLA